MDTAGTLTFRSFAKVATPGQLVVTSDIRGDETEMPWAVADGESVQTANTPDSWRSTTTQERETIVGDKLQEVKSRTGWGCTGGIAHGGLQD